MQMSRTCLAKGIGRWFGVNSLSPRWRRLVIVGELSHFGGEGRPMAEQMQGSAADGGWLSGRRYRWFLIALLSIGAIATTSIVVACRQGQDEPTRTGGDTPAAETPAKEWKDFAASHLRTW